MKNTDYVLVGLRIVWRLYIEIAPEHTNLGISNFFIHLKAERFISHGQEPVYIFFNFCGRTGEKPGKLSTDVMDLVCKDYY